MGQPRPSDFINVCVFIGKAAATAALWGALKAIETTIDFSKVVTTGVKGKLEEDKDHVCCKECGNKYPRSFMKN